MTGDLATASFNCTLDNRCRVKLSIQQDCQSTPDVLSSDVAKFFCSFIIESEIYLRFSEIAADYDCALETAAVHLRALLHNNFLNRLPAILGPLFPSFDFVTGKSGPRMAGRRL